MVVLESPTNRRPRVVSILGALRRIKRLGQDALAPLSRAVIVEVCRELDHVWRAGPLDPPNTVALFVQQVAEGNVSCEQVRHLHRGDGEFTGSAYCQARQRLPLAVLQALSGRVCDAIRRGTDGTDGTDGTGGVDGTGGGGPAAAADAYRWRGHRVHVIDGSSFAVPDTPELRG